MVHGRSGLVGGQAGRVPVPVLLMRVSPLGAAAAPALTPVSQGF